METKSTADSPADDLSVDLIWQADEIGKFIGRSTREAQRLLETGALPAKKIGRRWVSSRTQIREFFAEFLAA